MIKLYAGSNLTMAGAGYIGSLVFHDISLFLLASVNLLVGLIYMSMLEVKKDA